MKQYDTLRQGSMPPRILPFLWMKGEDESTIREELDAIERCGVKEVCLESRPYPDFCGPKWWITLDFLVPEMKKRGMRMWILDDRKFPTGYANGGFERQPEKAKIYLAERHMDILGPCRGGAVLVENFVGDGTLLGILAVPKPDTETLAVSGEGVIDLTDQVENGFVYFDLPEGAYRLFVLFTTRHFGGRENYMNLIDEDSVRVLLDEVYEKHYQHYAADFGGVIAGFFSDEPELGNVKGYPFDQTLGKRDVRLPWSRQLEERLREAWGAEFLTRLPGLWYEAGDRTAGTRSTYMEHMTDLVYQCFTRQVGQWCEAHGVEYIGHVIEDDNAHTRMGCSVGHYFREMQGQHMAGVDVVHHQIVPGFTRRIHQWIAGDADGEFFHFGLAKLASSAAHIDPKKQGRALCEIFGNYGWAEGVSLMRWLTCHMLVRGINVFTPHAFSMTYPDRDCPPHFYARGNNPQFDAFGQLMRFMQRGAHLLGDGAPMADAAVLYHAEAEWSGGETMLFQKPLRALAEHQLDADVIPCDALENAVIQNGQLHIGTACYPCLVLPWAACIRRETADFIIRAAAQGLPVFAVDGIAAMDTARHPLPREMAEELRASVRIVPLGELAQRVAADCPPHVACEGSWPDLRTMAVSYPDGQAVMFFNESVTKAVDTRVRFRDRADTSVLWYDPWFDREEAVSLADGAMPLHLEPGEALFCILDGRAGAAPVKTVQVETPLDLRWEVSCARETAYDDFRPLTVIEPAQPLPNMNGRGRQPGFTGWYRYDSAFDFRKEKGAAYRLYIPRGGDTVQIVLNGVDLGYLAQFPGWVDVTDALRDGPNTLRLEFSTTLVWLRKDGASTHLQLGPTGLGGVPVLRTLR